jgi:WD40 repeat protein
MFNLGSSVLTLRRTVSNGKVTYTKIGNPIALASNGRPITFCGTHLYAPRGLDLVDEIDINSGQTLRTLNQQEQMTRSSITSLSCSRNGAVLVIGDSEGTAFAYNLQNNTFTRFFDPNRAGGSATFVAANPDGTLYMVAGITTSSAGSSTTYPVQFVGTGSNSSGTYFPFLSARKPVTAVSWGKWPASVAQDSTLRVYETTARIRCSKLIDGIPTTVASSADMDLVAVGTNNGDVAVWRVGPSPTCDLVWRSESHVTNGPITGLSFTSDGMLEVAGGGRVITFAANR